MKRALRSIAFIVGLLPSLAAAQSAPANVGYHTILGRIGAVPGDVGPVQQIPWATILSKGLLDQIGTAQGTIPCRGATSWGPLVPGTSGLPLVSQSATACPGYAALGLVGGGTGNSTAAGARSSTGLNIDGYTAHNDSNYTILATDRTVGTNTALTAPRTWTLPAANSVNPGQEIAVADYALGVTATNTLTIASAGSDTIISGPTSVTSIAISVAGGGYRLRSDGVSKWSAVSVASSTTALGIKTPMDFGAACNGSTVDTTALQLWLTGISGNAFVGWIPAGTTCIYDGLLSITSNTTIYGYGATLQQKASGTGSANSGLVWGPTSQVGSGVDTTAIFGLTIDGNRANNTNTAGSGALYYVISATRVTLRDVKALNGREDGIVIGGDSSGNGRSSFVTLDNINSSNNRRNNISVFGLDRGVLGNLLVNSATNTTNDGPQCGIDFEPNGATSNNTNIYAFAISASANGALSSGTGGSGVCVFNSAANTTGLVINGVTAVGNQHYGVDVAASFSPANVRLMGVSGSGNGTALVDTANVVDWFPTTIQKGSASSCGTGFACIGVPN